MDELIFILLSQMTTHQSYERVFDRLKAKAPTWDVVAGMPLRRLKGLIKDAGLSNQKAPRIKTILRRIRADFAEFSLSQLAGLETPEAERYLTSLPGVSMKTAKCVLMYSLGREVLPVDTHVLRVSRRLGFTDQKVIGARAHRDLEALVPPEFRYSFHVNAIAHGRLRCLAQNPRCGACVLKSICLNKGRVNGGAQSGV